MFLLGDGGSGRWRLAGEIALAAQRDGAVVLLGDAPGPGRGPVLRVVDARAGTAGEVGAPPEHELQLIVAGTRPEGMPADAEVRPGPLTADQVGEVLAGYIPDGVDAQIARAAARTIHAQSGGNVGRTHELAVRWAREALAQRVAQLTASSSGTALAHEAERSALADDLLQWSALRPDLHVDPQTCPWRGLASYEEADEPWFAGRERLTAELVARVGAQRALLLVGGSGSGKSSLLRAGLLAALGAGALPGSAGWVRIVLRPGQHPMRELTETALAGAGSTGPDRVADLLARSLDGRGGSERILLVVDQFEECWTVCADPGEREAFLSTVADLTRNPNVAVTLVLAVRADHVGSIASHPGVAEALAGSSVFVGPMGEGELRRAIEGPAARAGLTLDTGLADALVADTLAEPGGLPLLSTALADLWARRDGSRLTLAAYVGSAGVGAAISGMAERAYAGLDDPHQRACRVLLRRLAGPGQGDAVARRRATLAELDSLPDPLVRECVEPLAAARLLTVSDGHVEVAHEALFRSWPRLREWLAEDAAVRDVQRRVTLAAGEWDREGREPSALWGGARLASAIDLLATRPEEFTGTEVAFVEAGAAKLDAERAQAEERARIAQRQNTRLRRVLAGLGVSLAIAMLAGLMAVRSGSEAAAQRQTATAQGLAAAAPTRAYLADRMLTAVEGVRTEESPQTVGSLLSVLDASGAVVDRIDTRSRLLGMDAAPGSRLAVATANLEDLHRLDMQTGESQVIWSREDANLQDVQMSPDGTLVAFQNVNRRTGAVTFDVAKVDTGKVIWSHPTDPEELVRGGFDFTDTPGQLAIATRTSLELHDVDGDDAAHTTIPWPRVDFSYVFMHRAHDDHMLLMASPEQPARLVDLSTGRVTEVDSIGSFGLVSPDGRLVVSQAGDQLGDEVTLVDLVAPDAAPVTLPYSGVLSNGAFTPDQRLVLLGSDDGSIEVIDLRERAPVETWSAHSGTVKGMAVAPDGRTAWSAGRDGDLIGWDVSGERRLQVRRPLPVPATAGQVSATGRVAATWDEGDDVTPHRVAAIDLADRTVLAGPFPPSDTAPGGLSALSGSITPDGRLLLIGMGVAPDSPSSLFQIVDVGSGDLLREVELPWWVLGITAAPDGRTAIAYGPGGAAVVELATAEVIARRDLPKDVFPVLPNSGAISPDGQMLALAQGTSVLVLDAATLADVTSWSAEEYDEVVALEWLPDGRTLAHGGTLGRLSFRAMPAGTLIDQPRQIAAGFILDLEASPDGKMLASIDTDAEIMLWDTRTRQQVGQPLKQSLMSWGWLAFQPDGKAVEAYFDREYSIRYDIDTDKLITRACAVAGRETTPAEWAAMHGDTPQQPTCGNLTEGDLLASP